MENTYKQRAGHNELYTVAAIMGTGHVTTADDDQQSCEESIKQGYSLETKYREAPKKVVGSCSGSKAEAQHRDEWWPVVLEARAL